MGSNDNTEYEAADAVSVACALSRVQKCRERAAITAQERTPLQNHLSSLRVLANFIFSSQLLTTYSRFHMRGCAGNILARCEHESLHARHAHGSNARPKCVANVTGFVLEPPGGRLK